jgi:hypothetical protein
LPQIACNIEYSLPNLELPVQGDNTYWSGGGGTDSVVAVPASRWCGANRQREVSDAGRQRVVGGTGKQKEQCRQEGATPVVWWCGSGTGGQMGWRRQVERGGWHRQCGGVVAAPTGRWGGTDRQREVGDLFSSHE